MPGQANAQLEPPFSIRLLDSSSSTRGQEPYLPDDYTLQSLLPASYRTGPTNHNVTAADVDTAVCVEKELDLHRLHAVMEQMWTCGRPIPPRALHYQLILSRKLLITEQMDMHLVWTTGRIYLKPIPRFLLDPQFWTDHLALDQPCACLIPAKGSTQGHFKAKSSIENTGKCHGGLRRCAMGFLFSYTALIAHESDFNIAQEKHLLPKEVRYPDWRIFVKELLEGHKVYENIYHKIDDRFKYGELRLSRLNKIYVRRFVWDGYLNHWNQYGSFLREHFTALASTIVFFAVVLNAMQVGTGIDALRDNDAFVSTSYGFTIFAILAPLIATGIILIVFAVVFVYNWVIAVRFWRKRSAEVGLNRPTCVDAYA